jgi:hypothetical protein
MDLEHIKKVVEAASKHASDNEKIAIPVLSAKLSRAAAEHPGDYTIVMANHVISRMQGNNKLFMSRAELREIYNKLFSRNTKFASVLSEELGELPALATPKMYDRKDTNDSVDVMKEAFDKVVDPVLASALASAFGDAKLPVNDTMIARAKNACEAQTVGLNLKKDFAVITAKDGVVVCRASFETPKGTTSVFMPVEFADQSALLPQVFIGNAGPEDLTKETLASYIGSHAGEKLKVDAALVLRAALSVKGELNKVSEVDLAVTKLNADRETAAQLAAPQVIGQKFDQEGKNLVVETPAYKDPEIETFARAFDSALGVASFKFKKAVVLAGRDIVVRAATGFGLTNPQVSVCDSDDSTVWYAVAANSGRVAFKVPVKVEANRPVYPTMLIANGLPDSFTKDSIDVLLASNSVDYKTSAVASPHYGLKPSELINIVRSAAAEENYEKAEDALNILAQSGDDKAYSVAFAEFSDSLSQNKETKSAAQKCSMIVKSASSQHEICGHTGLPLHKTYVDKNGNCLPMYRKQMLESNDGAAYIMNSKIFF